jgi:tetratricopeptide (TPR) repeat protein
VDAWLDTEPNRLDPSFRDRLYRTTNGHALFTVETVAAMQERRDLTLDSENRWIAGDTVGWDKLPPRVEAAIAARTTQLPTEVRRDLDAASVQGHDFLADVAATARGATSEELGSRLAELTATSHPLVEFVGVADVSGRRVDRYRFRHDTFRQAMEDGLAAPDRARLHGATGRALADLYADQLDEVAVDLARHFDAAGLVDEAITAHERAGRRAIRMSATAEAVVHLRRALELLDGQDASAERDTHTLGLLSALGTCLQAHAGYNAPETHDVYERIRALIPVVGATMESAEALGALIAIDALRARYGAATEGADRLLAIARSLGAEPIEVVAHTQLGWTALMTARLPAAEHHLDRAVEMYDDEWDAWLTDAVGFHVSATARTWRALVHWYRGRPDRSRQDADAAIESARRAHSPWSLVFALQVAGSTVHEHLREGREVLEFCGEAGVLAEREGFAFYTAASTLHRGLGSCLLGDAHRGLPDLEEGLARWAELGTLAFRPWITAVNLRFYIDDGRLDAAERALREVEHWMTDGEEALASLWLPLARGHVLRARGNDDEAERALRDGLSFLAGAGAPGVGLRTATMLAELLCDHSRHDEAREILTPALEAVEGGEGTVDVIEAREALDRAGR